MPLLVLALAGLGFATTFGPGEAAAAGLPTAGVGLLHLGDALPNASNQSSYSLVIVSQDDANSAAALPGTSVAYMNGTDINTSFSCGVPYSQALARGWLLRDARGNLLVNSQYGSYVGDVGNSAYQQAWITNTLAFMTAHPGLKGVYIDEVLNDIKPITGTYPAAYPNQPAWAAAQLSFIKAVGPALQAHGYYVLANAVGYIAGDPDSLDGTTDVAWWQQLGPYVNGLMNEYYQETQDGNNTLRASGTSSWTQYWDGWQRLISTAQNMGKDFVGVTYGAPGDTQTMTYAKASFLQQWNGGNSTLIFNPTDNSDPWNPAWTTNIGQPAATSQQVGTGWMRQYTNGIALVNPDPNNPQTFQLPGSYLTPNGTTVTTVTLQPTTGMILQTGSHRNGTRNGHVAASRSLASAAPAHARAHRATSR